MLELKNISLSVEDEFTGNGQKEILRDVSLTIETGKLVVVTGPNGGGKSTLAKIIAGIVTPKSGTDSSGWRRCYRSGHHTKSDPWNQLCFPAAGSL